VTNDGNSTNCDRLRGSLCNGNVLTEGITLLDSVLPTKVPKYNIVSVPDSLVTMTGAGHVTLRGLTLEGVRGTAVKIERATQNKLVGCTLRNIGSWAVSISGTNSGVVGCDISATGDGGIRISGGDRKTLAPAGLYAKNNHIHNWSRWNRMNRHGIAIDGVGNRAAHNLLHDSPHAATNFSGNDHVIEFNEIHNVCNEANDSGAIYAGRNWTMRGTVIRHNYLHHKVRPKSDWFNAVSIRISPEITH